MKRFGMLTLALVAFTSLACEGPVPEPEPGPKPSAKPEIPEPADLVIEDLTPGTGERAVKDGDKIKVHYVGRLLRTNFKFDSAEGDKTFPFTVGQGVIEGWSKGVVGMKVGGKRKLTIPSKMAYGESGHPPKIPANAPLVFEIELVAFDDAPPAASGSAAAGPSGSAKAEPAPSSSAKAGGTAKPKAPAAPKPTSAP